VLALVFVQQGSCFHGALGIRDSPRYLLPVIQLHKHTGGGPGGGGIPQCPGGGGPQGIGGGPQGPGIGGAPYILWRLIGDF
jgi:hypothetical protein